MGYYDNILNLLSIVLILMILFVIVYGCQYKHYNLHNKQRTNYERFENKRNDMEMNDYSEKEIKKELEMKKENENEIEIKKEKFNVDISAFEKSILDGLSNGSVTTDKLTSLIKDEKFTEKNLENLINYVETFKGMTD